MREEEIILSTITNNQEYAKKVMQYLKSDYFTDRKEKSVFRLMEDYYIKYKSVPTKDAMLVMVESDDSIAENDYSDVKQIIKDTYKTEYEYDIDWLLDTTEKFCRTKATYNAIMKSVLIINGDDKKHSETAIPGMLQDALNISFDQKTGHDYINDAQERFKFYNAVEHRVPCSIDLLNKVTGEGPPKKTLNIVIAPPKGGKSLFMCSLACDYLRQGFNVLYVTLELAEERVGERIDANMFNIAISEIKSLDSDTFNKKIDKIKSKTNGALKIKEYPTKSASAANFRTLLDDLKTKHSFVCDVMIVDYLGITASSQYRNSGGSVNSYTYQKAVSEELRAIAGEYNLVMWTAVQTNRSAYNASDYDMDAISDSSGPLMTADFVIGIIRTPELDELQQMILKQLASRYGDPSYYNKFVVGLDKSRMKMYNVEQSAQETIVDSSAEEKAVRHKSNTTNKKFGQTTGKSTTTKSSNTDDISDWKFE